ncbi:acetate/propionate family kinase [Dermabacter hominis]|uniref:acetate/propionate family kinase n=1 Tax=Dermabacter hominis TaxID=36740 RepID=UPI0021A566A6|nr:acetate kinase [Dermabacter hominis]MCT1716338.1 acetate kinase [Dermabacter hominis]MCT1789519.1 acetate kinase [Dermabacter hominis]
MTNSNVLVINSGSSSIKFQLIDPTSNHVTASGIVERITLPTGNASIEAGDKEETWEGAIPDHVKGMQVVEELFAKVGVELTEETVSAVGHRVVQGGAVFPEATLVTDEVRDQIHELGALAPLHNYAAVDGINGARALLPNLPHVVVFDTSFFTQLPPEAYTYAINKDVAEQYKIRRYGAHGTSHEFISSRVPGFLGREGEDLRQIVLHLGNGASASAVKNGKPVDTSMGLTPLEGLVMGTRSGDIDPSVYALLSRQAGMDPAEVDTLLNKKSGLMGQLGMSDFRDITAAVESGDENAKLTLGMWAHRVKKYVGAYAFILGGLDVITFTAGIGENASLARSSALEGLEEFGIILDEEANAQRKKEPWIISAPESKVTVLVYPTNEELAIAQQTLAVARG